MNAAMAVGQLQLSVFSPFCAENFFSKVNFTAYNLVVSMNVKKMMHNCSFPSAEYCYTFETVFHIGNFVIENLKTLCNGYTLVLNSLFTNQFTDSMER